MNDEIRVDPNSAYASGTNAWSLAVEMRGISNSFKGRVENTQASAVEPLAQRGYPAYGEKYANAMVQVEYHAGSLAQGGQDAASMAVGTDNANAADMAAARAAARSGLPARMNR